jgi:S1-C subfamily serine protease
MHKPETAHSLSRDKTRFPAGTVGLCMILALACRMTAAAAGTGFFVTADGHFLTAAHVIGTCARAAVETPSGVLDAKRLSQSEALDLAVLQTTEKPRHFAALGPAALPGAPVTIIRYRQGGGLSSRSAVSGTIVGGLRAPPERLLVDFAAPIEGGNSGSPVIDDRSRLVIGMLQAKDSARAERGVALAGLAIRPFLQAAQVPVSLTPPAVPAEGTDPVGGDFTFPVSCRDR